MLCFMIFFLKTLFNEKHRGTKKAYHTQHVGKMNIQEFTMKLHELDKTRLMSPNACKQINNIITSATDMSNQPEDMSTKNMDILLNDIDELPWSFTNISKPFFGIRIV